MPAKTRLPDRATIIVCFQRTAFPSTGLRTARNMAYSLLYATVSLTLAQKRLSGVEILECFEREIKDLQYYGFICEEEVDVLLFLTYALIASLLENQEVVEDALRVWNKAYGYLTSKLTP